MLENRKTAVAFSEDDLLELQRIIIDRDASGALVFLKRSVYDRIARSQQGRLKSHLDTSGNPVDMFKTGPGGATPNK